MAETVYVLCALTSIACAALLWRGHARSRGARFLLWSSLCFAGLALNNILLFADKVVFPGHDLSIWRTIAAVAGMLLLMYGLVWDTE
jgi:hypothetical protein